MISHRLSSEETDAIKHDIEGKGMGPIAVARWFQKKANHFLQRFRTDWIVCVRLIVQPTIKKFSWNKYWLNGCYQLLWQKFIEKNDVPKLKNTYVQKSKFFVIDMLSQWKLQSRGRKNDQSSSKLLKFQF